MSTYITLTGRNAGAPYYIKKSAIEMVSLQTKSLSFKEDFYNIFNPNDKIVPEKYVLVSLSNWDFIPTGSYDEIIKKLR